MNVRAMLLRRTALAAAAIVTVSGAVAIAILRGESSSSEPLAPKQSATTHANGDAESVAGRRIVVSGSEAANKVYDVPWHAGPSEIQPARLYEKYLERANSGDANAQYILATAIAECLNVAKTDAEFDIDRLERSDLPREFVDAAKQRFRNCKPLHEALPRLQDEYDRWFIAASHADHPLVLMKRKDVSPAEKAKLIKRAVTGPYPEPYLYAQAFLEAAEFYRTNPANVDQHREEAWLLLYCDASYQCDQEKERQALRLSHHSHDYEEIVATEAALRESITHGKWDELGL